MCRALVSTADWVTAFWNAAADDALGIGLQNVFGTTIKRIADQWLTQEELASAFFQRKPSKRIGHTSKI
jgi:hypothetical protein